MTKHFRSFRSALFACGLLLVLVAVPGVLTWRVWRQEQLNQALIVAIERHNVAEVRQLLEQGADIETRGRFGRPVSARPSWRSLLAHADKDNKAPTVLSLAVLSGQSESVSMLLEHGAAANARYGDDYTPIMAACLTNNVRIVQNLLKRGANVNAQAKDGTTPLMMTVCMDYDIDDTLLVETLLSTGANVNLRSNQGETALSNALASQAVAVRHHSTAQETKENGIIHLLQYAGGTK